VVKKDALPRSANIKKNLKAQCLVHRLKKYHQKTPKEKKIKALKQEGIEGIWHILSAAIPFLLNLFKPT
jgi:hypothetical protein